MFWFSQQLLSETLIILRRTEWCVTKNVYWSSCKVPVILVRFTWQMKFLYRCSKNTQISKFQKIHSVGAEMFHANGRRDRWTDMTNVIVTFYDLANTPKMFVTVLFKPASWHEEVISPFGLSVVELICVVNFIFCCLSFVDIWSEV